MPTCISACARRRRLRPTRRPISPQVATLSYLALEYPRHDGRLRISHSEIPNFPAMNNSRTVAWPVRVYYEDTDSGGVVYYANYLKYMERARSEWLRWLGFEQDELARDHDVVFAVRTAQIDYLRPARFNDRLTVTAALIDEGRVSVTFSQHVLRAPVERASTQGYIENYACEEMMADKENKLCAGEIRIACLRDSSLRPRAIPTHILAEIHRAGRIDLYSLAHHCERTGAARHAAVADPVGSVLVRDLPQAQRDARRTRGGRAIRDALLVGRRSLATRSRAVAQAGPVERHGKHLSRGLQGIRACASARQRRLARAHGERAARHARRAQSRDRAARAASAVSRHRRLDEPIRGPVRHGVGPHEFVPRARERQSGEPADGGARHRRGPHRHRDGPRRRHPRSDRVQPLRDRARPHRQSLSQLPGGIFLGVAAAGPRVRYEMSATQRLVS